MVTVYTKNAEDDEDYSEDILDIRSPLQIYLQEIRNILNGQEASVIGALDMTIDLEGYIYEMNLEEIDIKQKIMESLMKYSQLYYRFSTVIDVKFYKGDVRDICIIDFTIDKLPRFKFIVK